MVRRYVRLLVHKAKSGQGEVAGRSMAAPAYVPSQYVRGFGPCSWMANEKGGLLLEALIAVGLLSTVLAAALAGLATGSRSVGTIHERVTSQNIARSQLEYTMSDTYYEPPYNATTTVAAPPGYTVEVEAQEYPGADENLETIVVTVFHDGQLTLTVEGIKARR